MNMEKLDTLLPLQHKPDLRDIRQTHAAIRKMIHRTPVLRSTQLNALCEAELYFKCENFQKIGAFKMRGAASAAVRLDLGVSSRGLATHSSGNHAQAVARSAQQLGIPAYIVMPENAPAIKRAATEAYGADIRLCAPTLEARETTLQAVVEETGAAFIHPYDNYDVIAGQATCALELLEDTEALDVLMAPVGGGGLMSGSCLSARYLYPSVQLIGAEPREVDDAYRSLQAGHIVTNTSIDTIADGLRTNLGQRTFTILQEHLNDLLCVEENSIVRAMRLIWERMKIIIEPSCAVPFAAVLENPDRFRGKRIGIILTGGNVDLENLPFHS